LNEYRPAGAILNVLRDLIKAGQISDVSHACRLYSTEHPQARHFVASCLPELIVNNYKPIGETVDFREFIAWSEENPEWSNKISSNAIWLRLEGIIKGMVKNLREFKNSPKWREVCVSARCYSGQVGKLPRSLGNLIGRRERG
jgi:hypothetical protein